MAMAHAEQSERKKEKKERRANLRRFREGKITLARSRRVGVRRILQTGR